MIKTLLKILLITLMLQLTLQARIINIDHIITIAKNNNKHLFVWLHKTDCGYCEKMREFTLENEVIEEFIEKNFIFIHINVYEKDSVKYDGFRGNGLEFAKEIGYNFYPSSLFFADDGEIIFAEVGFIDKQSISNQERFYKILNFIQSRSYENIDYSEYKFELKEEL